MTTMAREMQARGLQRAPAVGRVLLARGAMLAARFWLALMAVALIAVPILIAVRVHERGLEFGARIDSPPALVSRVDAAEWHSVGQRLPAHAPPLVLAYGDIREGASAPSAITPRQFDLDLTMLRIAGYRTLNSEQYLRYLGSGPWPARSVIIIFSGGSQDLWKFADTILARHRMHAVSLLSATGIRTHWGARLSWPEIGRMRESGRWDFATAGARADALASKGAAMRRLVRWVERARAPGADQLLRALAADTAIPVGAAPLGQRDRWERSGGGVAPLLARGNRFVLTGAQRSERVFFARAATAGWGNYVLSVLIAGLRPRGVSDASVIVRVGSARSEIVRLSARQATLLHRPRGRWIAAGRARLRQADEHLLRITVRDRLTIVAVDGRTRFVAAMSGGLASRGGIGLIGVRMGPRAPWPHFSRLVVAPVS